MSKIFLVDDEQGLRPLEEQPYESEELLQNLLAQYPGALGGPRGPALATGLEGACGTR